MKNRLIDFVKVYDNFLSNEECDLALESIKKIDYWNRHEFSTADGKIIQYTNELDVTWSLTTELTKIQDKMWEGIEKYILKDNSNEYFNGWSGYTPLRVNRYMPGTEMNLHCDHIHSMFDGERKGIPILSIVGILNDDYVGGKFIFWDDTTINLPKGSLMIFPSNFLYPHKVTKVESGIRYSYVSWVW